MAVVRVSILCASLLLFGPLSSLGATCDNDPEVDLCDIDRGDDNGGGDNGSDDNGGDDTESSVAFSPQVSGQHLIMLLALAVRGEGLSSLLVVPWIWSFPSVVKAAAVTAPSTCADVKKIYKDNACCGETSKALTQAVCPPVPYNFTKPNCPNAGPQAPRDLTRTEGVFASGSLTPQVSILTDEQCGFLTLANVHFHLGAEHKTDEVSTLPTGQSGNRRLASGQSLRSGYECNAAKELSTEAKASYNWQYCKDVEVGKTYEVHYVHSSAAYGVKDVEGVSVGDIDDGLGGAANGRGMLNPTICVQAQIYLISSAVEDKDGEVTDIFHGWTLEGDEHFKEAYGYQGSTTGQSHTNTVCSPYFIHWHVDMRCHIVSPKSFDHMCKEMKETYNMDADLYPHGSREILDSKYVVKAEYIKKLEDNNQATASR